MHRVTSKGKTYYYFQIGRGTEGQGPRSTLPSDPQSAEFWTAYEALAGPKATLTGKPAPGSIADLVAQYRGDDRQSIKPSPEWGAFADATRVNYSIYLDRMIEAWGTKPAKILHASDALEARDAMAATPYAANSFLAVGRSLFKYGVPRRFSDINPFREVPDVPIGEEGHIPWPEWAWTYVIALAPEDIGRFVFVALHTGQRESDVVRMGPPDRDGAGLWTKPKKTGRKRGRIWLPLTTAALVGFDRMEREPMTFVNPRFKAPVVVPTGQTYVFSPRGKAYNPDSLRSRWNRWLDTEAGRTLKAKWVDHCRFLAERAGEEFDPEEAKQPALHGLRGSAVTLRRMAGANHQQIANDIGMSPPMVMRYTRFMDQKAAAESNIVLMEEADSRRKGKG